jgi:hypothetical protein
MKSIDLDNIQGNQAVAFGDSANLDAFSRLRVAQLTTVLDLKHLHDKQPLLVDEVVNGSATSVYSTSLSSVTMSVNAANDYVIRQTFQRFEYQSGKSQLIFCTFSGFQSETNVIKRVGYFSTSTLAPYTTALDGLFLDSDGTDISINIYRSGTVIENTSQSSWNIDTLDGTGPSGITVDWSKNFILVIDFQFLGVGRVRWGADIDGKIVYFHESKHANNLSSVYMSSPNQPIRYEIRATGAAESSFQMICAAVNSEGSINTIGRDGGIDDDGTFLNANSTSQWYYAVGLRLAATRIDTTVDIISGSLLSATNDNFLYRIVRNPTYNGTVTYNTVTDYSIEYGIGATTNTITSMGYILYSGNGTKQTNQPFDLETAIRLGMSLGGTLDEHVLIVKPLSSNLDIHRSINFRELA